MSPFSKLKTLKRSQGVINSVRGLVIVGNNLCGCGIYELVRVGNEHLVGEIIRLSGNTATIQVYEETSGLAVGDPIYPMGNKSLRNLGQE